MAASKQSDTEQGDSDGEQLARHGQTPASMIMAVTRAAAGVGLVERGTTAAPSLGLMHYGLMLAGLGTALLGPILPLLARQWAMQDSQSGLLMMAKFCGAFLGGVSVSGRLRRSLLVGLSAGTVGFGMFALAPTMSVGCVGLFVGGFGLGQIITSINILAGRRFTAQRGSALSLLNFSFSLGAMLSALLAAWLLPLFALRGLLECFAGTFLLGGIALLVQMRRGGAGLSSASGSEEFEVLAGDAPEAGIGGKAYLYFAGLLFLYGGFETCLSGWLTTFALRYGDRTLVVSEYTTLLLWMSLTVGRVVAASAVMRGWARGRCNAGGSGWLRSLRQGWRRRIRPRRSRDLRCCWG